MHVHILSKIKMLVWFHECVKSERLTSVWADSAALRGGRICRHAVFREHFFKLCQGSVSPHACWVKVCAAHSEPSLCEILQELIQPEWRTESSVSIPLALGHLYYCTSVYDTVKTGPCWLTWACSCHGCCADGCYSRTLDALKMYQLWFSSAHSQSPPLWFFFSLNTKSKRRFAILFIQSMHFNFCYYKPNLKA